MIYGNGTPNTDKSQRSSRMAQSYKYNKELFSDVKSDSDNNSFYDTNSYFNNLFA